jgi:hypothetical protein
MQSRSARQSGKVVRGGSWNNSANNARCAYRNRNTADKRLLKRRSAVNFTRRFKRNLCEYPAEDISIAELDASVEGWINHVRYGDTWGLREHVFSTHPIPKVSSQKRR